MCNCHSIPECCVMFSGIKLSIRLFNLFLGNTTNDVLQPHYRIVVRQWNGNVNQINRNF